jgi:hypothetical protein
VRSSSAASGCEQGRGWPAASTAGRPLWSAAPRRRPARTAGTGPLAVPAGAAAGQPGSLLVGWGDDRRRGFLGVAADPTRPDDPLLAPRQASDHQADAPPRPHGPFGQLLHHVEPDRSLWSSGCSMPCCPPRGRLARPLSYHADPSACAVADHRSRKHPRILRQDDQITLLDPANTGIGQPCVGPVGHRLCRRRVHQARHSNTQDPWVRRWRAACCPGADGACRPPLRWRSNHVRCAGSSDRCARVVRRGRHWSRTFGAVTMNWGSAGLRVDSAQWA